LAAGTCCSSLTVIAEAAQASAAAGPVNAEVVGHNCLREAACPCCSAPCSCNVALQEAIESTEVDKAQAASVRLHNAVASHSTAHHSRHMCSSTLVGMDGSGTAGDCCDVVRRRRRRLDAVQEVLVAAEQSPEHRHRRRAVHFLLLPSQVRRLGPVVAAQPADVCDPSCRLGARFLCSRGLPQAAICNASSMSVLSLLRRDAVNISSSP
jgi:hypothetical protein